MKGEKERGKGSFGACFLGMLPPTESQVPMLSLSSCPCRLSRNPRPLSLSNRPQSATCPCVWTPKKGRRLPTCRTRIAVTRSFSCITSRVPLPRASFLASFPCLFVLVLFLSLVGIIMSYTHSPIFIFYKTRFY